MNLSTAVKLGKHIWLATDGGMTRPDGYFGWVIATDSHILWRGGGYVQGNGNSWNPYALKVPACSPFSAS
eukprot:780044-Ditylum_brightwellii.AAC.1